MCTQDDQLGRDPDRRNNKLWYAKPGFVSGARVADKAVSWVGAGANTTYLQVSSSLLTEQKLANATFFASPQCLGEFL